MSHTDAVVMTGMGAAASLGVSLDAFWSGIAARLPPARFAFASASSSARDASRGTAQTPSETASARGFSRLSANAFSRIVMNAAAGAAAATRSRQGDLLAGPESAIFQRRVRAELKMR